MDEKNVAMLPDIVRTIIIDAPIEKVWKAVSNSEALAEWLMPNDFEPILGHKFTFKSEPKGEWDGTVYCEVKELVPPKRLAFTWAGNDMDQYVSFDLEEEDGKTKFTLVHAGWKVQHGMIREIMYDGWGYILEDLGTKIGDRNGGYLS